MHPGFLRLAIGTALLVLVAVTASADEVRLKNGDRYTGKVTELSTGTLRFDTGHGTVSIPWPDVQMLDVADPMMATVRHNSPRLASVRSIESGGVVLEPGDLVVPMQDLLRLVRVEPFAMGGDASAGLQSSGGNTEVNSLRVDGELVARTMNNRYTVNAAVSQASNNGVSTDEKATGALRYDRFFNGRFYANANALLTHDQFRDLRLRTAIGVALGYQATDNARVRLGVEAGYGYVDERFAHATGDRYHAARDSVRFDVFIIGQRLSVFHRHDGFFGLIGSKRLFVQTRNGLRMVLIGGVVATVEYDVDYDRAALPGRKRTDHTAGLTLGYRFGRT